MSNETLRSVSVQPLVDLVTRLCSTEDESWFNNQTFAKMVGFSPRTIIRWRQNGTIPWTKADLAAIRLGQHPILVWGDEWLALDSDDELVAAVLAEAHYTTEALDQVESEA